MHSRAVSLLACEGEVGWLTGLGPHAAHHHMTQRLINIVITWKKMRLELEQAEMMLE